MDEQLILKIRSKNSAFIVKYEGSLEQILKHMLKHNAFAAKGISYDIYREGEKDTVISIDRDALGF